jgi:threonine/homoserine/homoserine lactone efflux protein
MDAMMMLALAGAAAANSAAPGPAILIAASRAATDGLTAGLRFTFGIAVADVLLIAASWAMIAGAMSLSDVALEALRLGGLALLTGLGVAMLAGPAGAAGGLPSLGRLRAGDGVLGLALGLSSPMNLLFMFALLPQFVDAERLDATSVALASGVVLIGGLGPFLAACILSARVLRTGPRMARRITRGCGAALLGLAGLALIGSA